jgi:hypothetical protein
VVCPGPGCGRSCGLAWDTRKIREAIMNDQHTCTFDQVEMDFGLKAKINNGGMYDTRS